MTDEEYKGIYTILNDIKETVNELKLCNTRYDSKLDSLKEDLDKVSKEQEQLKSIIYSGNYGKNSLLEEAKLSHSKINHLEGKIQTQKSEISQLQDRWIKFLWAMSVTIVVGIVIAIL